MRDSWTEDFKVYKDGTPKTLFLQIHGWICSWFSQSRWPILLYFKTVHTWTLTVLPHIHEHSHLITKIIKMQDRDYNIDGNKKPKKNKKTLNQMMLFYFFQDYVVDQDAERKNASLTCRCHWQDSVIEAVWVYSKEVIWIHNKVFGHAEVAKLSTYCHQNSPRESQSAGIGPKVRKSAEIGCLDCICLCQYHSLCANDALSSLYICFVKHFFSQGSHQGFKAKNTSNMDMCRYVATLNSIQETSWSPTTVSSWLHSVLHHLCVFLGPPVFTLIKQHPELCAAWWLKHLKLSSHLKKLQSNLLES